MTPDRWRQIEHLYHAVRNCDPEERTALLVSTDPEVRSRVERMLEIVMPGVSVRQFDISSDEKRVVYSQPPTGEATELWIATLDRSSPPRRIGNDREVIPYFGPNGEVFFRLTDGPAYYVGVMAADGTARRKALPLRIANLDNISPDRRMVVGTAEPPNGAIPPTVVLPLDGSPPTQVCTALCTPAWSPDGRYLYLTVADSSRDGEPGKTVAIPLLPARGCPTCLPN